MHLLLLTQFQFFFVDVAVTFPSCAPQEMAHEASPLTFTEMKEPALTLPYGCSSMNVEDCVGLVCRHCSSECCNRNTGEPEELQRTRSQHFFICARAIMPPIVHLLLDSNQWGSLGLICQPTGSPQTHRVTDSKWSLSVFEDTGQQGNTASQLSVNLVLGLGIKTKGCTRNKTPVIICKFRCAVKPWHITLPLLLYFSCKICFRNPYLYKQKWVLRSTVSSREPK